MDTLLDPELDPVAVVTGAGSGIGRAIARRLSQAGYTSILVGRRPAPLHETARLIADDGGRSITASADITTADGRRTILTAVRDTGLQWRALVNNAGGSHAGPLFDQDLQQWRDEFAVNVEAAAFLSFAAIEQMRHTSGAAIVNIASVYGSIALNPSFYQDLYPTETPQGPTRAVAYSPSKAALRMLTRELAVAAAPLGVRVNTVSPGAIEVDSSGIPPDRMSEFGRLAPMGRVGQPHEVAGAVAFLLSTEASFITGAELIVDGGWTCW